MDDKHLVYKHDGATDHLSKNKQMINFKDTHGIINKVIDENNIYLHSLHSIPDLRN